MKPLIALLLISAAAWAQGAPASSLPDAPSAVIANPEPAKPYNFRRDFATTAALSTGGVLALAYANKSGAHQCVVREELRRDPGAEFRRTVKLGGLATGGLLVTSLVLHKFHKDGAAKKVLLVTKLTAAGLAGAAVAEMGAGCN